MRTQSLISDSKSISDTVGFEILGPLLGADVESAIKTALSDGAIFAAGKKPLSILQHELEGSIRSIETHPRGRLFQDYEKAGHLSADVGPPRPDPGLEPASPPTG